MLRDTGSTTGTFIKIAGRAEIENVLFYCNSRTWSLRWEATNSRQDFKTTPWPYKSSKALPWGTAYRYQTTRKWQSAANRPTYWTSPKTNIYLTSTPPLPQSVTSSTSRIWAQPTAPGDASHMKVKWVSYSRSWTRQCSRLGQAKLMCVPSRLRLWASAPTPMPVSFVTRMTRTACTCRASIMRPVSGVVRT